MKRRSLLAAAFVAAFAGAAACSTFGTHDEGTPAAESDSGAEAGVPGEDGQATNETGTPDDAAPPVDGGSLNPCPIGVGPPMNVVQLPSRRVCIDRTEVTSAQYAAFRAIIKDTTALSARVPAGCAGVSAAGLTTADGKGQLPRTSVSFCSAAYFCAAQGKRLCGSLADGGPVIVTNDGVDDPPMEWEIACANGNPGNFYPWGTTDKTGVVAAKCLTKDGYPDAAAPREAGLEPTCGPSGNAGPFDMIGNVEELVNGRRDVDGGASYTFLRGGSYEGTVAGNGCASVHGVDAPNGTYTTGRPTIGFRCCADPK